MGLEVCTVRNDGKRVVLIVNGTAVEMPWQAADAISDRLRFHARQVEEIQNPKQVVMDHAILTRIGFPVGVAYNKKLVADAEREAAWNSDLRRYIPGGVRSRHRVGVPTIAIAKTIHGKPVGEVDHAKPR